MIVCVFINLKLKALNHQLHKVKRIFVFDGFERFDRILVLTRARRLERELEDAEQRAEVVTTTLIRSRSMHRDYN